MVKSETSKSKKVEKPSDNNDLKEFLRRYQELCNEMNCHIVGEPFSARVEHEGSVWVTTECKLIVRRRDGS